MAALAQLAKLFGRPIQRSYMSGSSIARFSNVLGSLQQDGGPIGLDLPDAARRLLMSVKDKMVPLSGIVPLTGLQEDEALEAIGLLRDRDVVEIFVPEDDKQKYLRLTPAGYSLLAKA